MSAIDLLWRKETALTRARHRLMNLVVDFPGCAPVVGELQIHYRPILELKEYELHFHYEIMRAKSIGELVP